jgi:hypothetical protein
MIGLHLSEGQAFCILFGIMVGALVYERVSEIRKEVGRQRRRDRLVNEVKKIQKAD